MVLESISDIKNFQDKSSPVKLVQNCARYQGVLQLLLNMVAAPVNIGLNLGFSAIDVDTGTKRKSPANSRPSSAALMKMRKLRNDWEDKRFRVISLTHQLAWACLRQLVDGNYDAIMCITKLKVPYRKMSSLPGDGVTLTEAMTIILEQVPYPVGSADLLTCLVDDTKDLLLTKVDENTISYFKTMISDFGPQSRFLNFYEACVSCSGEPLKRNQNIVLKELITGVKDQKNSILITLYTIPGQEYAPLPYDKLTSVDEPNQYLGQDYFVGAGSRGYPKVFVAWEWHSQWKVGTNSLFYNPKSLGG